MANPLTAINADVDEADVNKMLVCLLEQESACEIKLLSRGTFGFVFSIRFTAIEVMGEQIYNQFNTFRVDHTDGKIIETSYDTEEPFATFCCKLVPILDVESSHTIMITLPDNPPIQQVTSTKLAFMNECNKQRHIYALTNYNLNSVCLPLFYFNIVKLTTPSNFGRFIRFIFEKTSIFIEQPPPDLHYGISFMPLSPNTISTTQITPATPAILSSTGFISHEDHMTLILGFIDSYTKETLDETRVIHIFQHEFMYPIVSVVSLVMRLYSVGYCHGDLHVRNIVVNPVPSGMTDSSHEPIIYFGPTFTLIDTGFAYKHGKHVLADFSTNYESFKLIIMELIFRQAPKAGQNMLTFEPLSWFPRLFMKQIENVNGTDLKIDEDRCKVIFILYYYYERYRVNFERHQVGLFVTLYTPERLEALRKQNHKISEVIVDYIRSLTSRGNPLFLYNSQGGHRRNYYVSNRKQTKINKKHTRSVRRRKSQKRRRRQRSKSKRY
jgi:hypothetical protein